MTDAMITNSWSRHRVTMITLRSDWLAWSLTTFDYTWLWSRILWSLLTFNYDHKFVIRTPIDHDVTDNNVVLHSACCNNVFSLGLIHKLLFCSKYATPSLINVMSLAAIDGQHWRTCSLYRLFLLAAVITDNLKRRSRIRDHRHFVYKYSY